jgi:hypothetical protein
VLFVAERRKPCLAHRSKQCVPGLMFSDLRVFKIPEMSSSKSEAHRFAPTTTTTTTTTITTTTQNFT